MGILSNKFVINKGLVNEFLITIKQDHETLPMIIDPTDTFEAVLYKLDTDAEVARISQVSNDDGIVEVYDDANGQILLKFTDVLTDTLVKERGTKADRYYIKPMYRLSIECNTVNNGNFVAKIQEVYVD